MKSKKGSWKRSYASSSSPLRKGGGGGEDAKLKSEKKLFLGRRKERGGKSKASGRVTLADLAQSVPRAAAAASTSGTGTGMESSPNVGNGSMGHGDQMMWKGSMELEQRDATTPSSTSRKSCSYSQEEEESSLSERESLVIDV